MTGEEERFPADAPIAHFESPASLRVEPLTETQVENPAQSPTVPTEPQTEPLTELLNEHSPETPTNTPTDTPTEPPTDRPVELLDNSRSAVESQETIQDGEEPYKTSETEKPDKVGTEASETPRGTANLDGNTLALASTDAVSSNDERALPAPQAQLNESEMPADATPRVSTPPHSVLLLPVQVDDALPPSNDNIETNRVSPYVSMDQFPTEDSSRASSNLHLEGSSVASIEAFAADGESAIPSQQTSSHYGPRTLRQHMLLTR
jgi:hypothetical protein